MTETPEKELELECSLCKDIYLEPKTLGCLHSFCLECLETYIERNHATSCLSCPLCRTPFQKQQASNFPTDSFLLHSLNIHNSLSNSISQQKKQKLMCLDEQNEATCYCLDCEIYFCETCATSHKNLKVTINHQIIPIQEMKNQTQINSNSNSRSQLFCQTHQQREMELYCEDCKVPICSLCVLQHAGHKLSAISDIVAKEKQTLMELINQLKPKEKELREGISKCEEMIKQLEISSTATQVQINELFNKIRIKLDEREQELLNQLEEVERNKKKELELQKEELKFGIESIIGSCHMIEHSLSLSTQTDSKLLAMRNLYHSRLDYLSNNMWRIQPSHHSLIEFSLPEKEEETLYSNLANIGVFDSNCISPEKCLISRPDKQRIFKDEEFKFKIISFSKDGKEMNKGGNGKKWRIRIEGESKNENNKRNEWKIVDLNNGKYDVKMKLKQEGKYSIFVQYEGLDIPSSPLPVHVYPKLKQRNYTEIKHPKLTFGEKGNGNGQFNYPYGITVNSKGKILVCDWGNHRIQLFDPDGKFVSTFGSYGNGNGQFNYPYGLTINSRGNIIVSDRDNHRIQIFDPEGKFITKFGSVGKDLGQFSHPRGIYVDMNDRIYVCDNGNHRIQIFDPEGNFISSFGSQGNGDNQFQNPIGIAINSKGSIIVSDFNNHRVRIFSSDGLFISTFGSQGNGQGQFNDPYGIYVDLYDNILVCDYSNNRVQIFGPTGEYITQFGVNCVNAATIDPKTQTIIVSGDDHKVSVY